MAYSKMTFKEFLFWAQITEEEFKKASKRQRTNWGSLARNARERHREKVRAQLGEDCAAKIAAIRKGENW
jgi:hypothetical protein